MGLWVLEPYVLLRAAGVLRFGTLGFAGQRAMRFETLRFCGVEGPFALELHVSAGKVVPCGLDRIFMQYRVHSVFGLHLLYAFDDIYLAGRGCDTNFTSWREDNTLCFDYLLVFVYFFLFWPLCPYSLRGALCSPTLYFSCGATCRCQNLHTFSHTPTPLAPAVNFFWAPFQ